MSQENVDVVRRAFDAFNSGGPSAQLEFIHPEVEFDEPERIPDRQVGLSGHDDFLGSVRKALEIFEVERFEAEELVDAGDRVVAAVHAFGRGKGVEIEGDFRRWEVWTLREGKVIRWDFYDSRRQALEAVGLRE